MESVEEKLKRKLKLSNIAIVFLLLILLIILIVVISRVFKLTNIIENNDSNMGLVTQSDDLIFYYNYGKGLVKKDKNEEKVLIDEQAYSINYFDGHVFYTTPNSVGGIDIKKIGIDGKGEKVILSTTSSSTKMYLKDSKIYYLTSNPNTLSNVDIDGKNPEVILQKGIVDFKVLDGIIYYSDIMGYLYSVDLNGKNDKIIVEKSLFDEFQIVKDYVYYYDNDKLMRVNLNNTSKIEEVTDKLNCDIYNATSNGIYYYDKEKSKISFVSLYGKKARDIVDVTNNKTKINLVGTVIYYIDEKDGKTITKLIGTNGKKID